MGRGRTLPFDTRRVVVAAVEAALDDAQRGRRRRGMTTGKALVVGAGLVAAGKLVASPLGRPVREAVEDRWEDLKERIGEELDGREPDDEPEDDVLDEDF